MIALTPNLWIYPFGTAGMIVLNPRDESPRTFVVKGTRIHAQIPVPTRFFSLDPVMQFQIVLACARAHVLTAPSVLRWIQKAVFVTPHDYALVHPCTWFLVDQELIWLGDWIEAVIAFVLAPLEHAAEAEQRVNQTRTLVDKKVAGQLEPEVYRVARTLGHQDTPGAT